MEGTRFRRRRVRDDFASAAETLIAARPTAVNLRWAVERLRALVASMPEDVEPSDVATRLAAEAERMHEEDIEANRRMGAYGARLIGRHGDVVTHCNAGALATAGYGTALGVIRAAWESGRRFGVYATETRRICKVRGSRLGSS